MSIAGAEFRVDFLRREVFLGLARRRNQLLQNGDDLLAGFEAKFQRAEHFLFGNLLRAGFHHHDALVAAGHDDVELRRAGFRVSRVGDVFAVDHADAHGADEVVERNIGNGERGARADDARARRDRAPDRPKGPWR